MTDIGGAFEQYREIETGEAFTPQGPYALKVELSETSVIVRGAVNSDQQQVEVGVHRGPLGRRWVLGSAVFDLSALCPPHDHSPTQAVEQLI